MTGDSPLADAFSLLWSFDDEVLGVAWLSIRVSSAAVLVAAALALPAAAGLALGRFPGRRLLRATARALMMVPSVLIGLLIYMTLGRQGPVGALELLYTPWAIAIAQALLAFPLLTSLFAAAVEGADPVTLDAARTAGAGPLGVARAAVHEAAPGLFAALVTGFARVIGETGMTLMVGGNITGETRTMTTAIATETMRGEFERAIAIGIVLLLISIAINVALLALEPRSDARAR